MNRKQVSDKRSEELLLEAAAKISARNCIDEIREKIIRINRFFTDKSFLSLMEKAFGEASVVMKKDSLLYRARIYNASDKPKKQIGYFNQDDGYQGYDEKESFVNLNSEWPIYGRMHPNGVRVLYTASDEKTAAKELNPSVGELVSIATIKTDCDLHIADLSNIKYSPKSDKVDQYKLKYVIELLSQGYSEKEYVFSQFVAGYCASLGYDGIGYRSKYSRKSDTNSKNGINYTIFNFDKCRAVSSKLYSIKNTTLEMKQIEPLLSEEILKTELKDIK